MEKQRMSGMQEEPGLLWAEQAGRLNETDEERSSVECRPAWADGEARTIFYGPAPMPGGGDLWLGQCSQVRLGGCGLI
jgi:hypothetical protein